MSENELRQWLFANWKGWIERREPAGSIGEGAPDIQLLVEGHVVPVELKVKRGGKIHMRAAQVGWHLHFYRSGGKSLFLIHHSNRVAILPGAQAANIMLSKYIDAKLSKYINVNSSSPDAEQMLRLGIEDMVTL